MIYLDNSATTIHKPDSVIDAVVQAMKTMGNASRGSHNDSLKADRVIFDLRRKLCIFFGGKNPRNIVFTKNSTEALNTAITGLAKDGDHIITTANEHNSVLRPIYRLASEKNIGYSIVPIDKDGVLKYEAIEDLIEENTSMMVVNHGSNVTGNIADLEKISGICKKHGIKLVVDASQTAGVIPIDVEKTGIDVLCFTGHKSLLGPQGTGGMYVSDSVYIRPFSVGGSGSKSFDKDHPSNMPTNLEAGTLNSHGLAGLSAAIDYINDKGIDNLRKHELDLADRFYRAVKDLDTVVTYGDFSTSYRCPIVSLNIGDEDASKISMLLSENYDVATRPGAHCAPLVHESFGTVEQGMVRFSFSSFNTIDEVDLAIKAVKEIAGS